MNEIYDFEGKRAGWFWPGLIIAGILFVLAFVLHPVAAVVASVPLTAALVSYVCGTPARQIVLTDSGVENRTTMTGFSYFDVTGVWCGGVNLLNHQAQPSEPRILIEHKMGVIDLQDRDLAKLASFTNCLLKSVKPSDNESLRAPFVNQYWMEERASFGDNLIKVCRQAPAFISKSRNRDVSGPLALVAVVMAFVLWVVFGAVVDNGPNKNDILIGFTAVLASLFSITGFISTIVFFANQKKYSSTGNAALVISPRGFALAQKDLDGSITWNEVKDVKKTRFGLVVSVAGATIVILEIYDLPLTHIHRLMKSNLA